MTARRLGWAIGGAVVLAVAGALLLGFVLPPDPVLGLADAAWLLALASYALAGALIVSRRPRHGVGWVLVAVGVLVALAGLADAYSAYALGSGTRGAVAARWVQSLLWDPAFAVLLVGLPLLFPTGRLPSRRWRPVATLGAVATVCLVVVSGLEPGPIGTDLPLQNPFGWEAGAAALELVDSVAEALIMLTAVLALGAPIVRYRRGGTVERCQLQWFVYAIGLLVLLSAASAMTDLLPIGDGVGVMLEVGALASVPIAIVVAIQRHGLYDVRVAVSRTLVYALLSVAIVVLYGAAVGAAGAAVTDRDVSVLPLLVTVAVAVAFAPSRQRLQAFVDRRLFGWRRDPYVALQELGRRLSSPQDPEEALRSVVNTVREALRLPYAALTSPTGEMRARSGEPTGEAVRIPMEHAGMPMGHLVVTAPGSHRVLSRPERRLLEDLAQLAAVAMHATDLTGELVRSRQALVDAREDERRRLRRELHDGIGPDLAGLALRLEATAATLDLRPDDAREEVIATARRLTAAVGDVRRIVYDLRPPALDDLGLEQALRQRAAEFGHGDPARGRPPLHVRFEVEGDLLGLPAALEVAAYRIVSEAMLNTWRHTAARNCTVTLHLGDGLQVEVSDDGGGLPLTIRPGVGMSSMVERARELGGRCSIGGGPEGGTQILAVIPVRA
jgi:signal transduction histidine kinase